MAESYLSNFFNNSCTFSINISTFETDIDEVNRTKIYTKNIPGVSADSVSVVKRWVNRTKTIYLDVTIDKGEDELFTEAIVVDTDVYNLWSYFVENGVLKITLYEIENEEPKFDLVTE